MTNLITSSLFLLCVNLTAAFLHVTDSYRRCDSCFGQVVSKKNWRSPCRTGLHMSAINFQGESSSSLRVTLPPGAQETRSLPEWLNSDDSNIALLGTKMIVCKGDDLWECRQPDIKWFGLKLSPVFVNRIDRSDQNKVSISILDSRTNIVSGSAAGNVLSKVMDRSTFAGGNSLSWEETGSEEWLLSADLVLSLRVPLPRLLPLPPGFNSVGSKIVKTTCNRRVVSNLQELREEYISWAMLPTDSQQ